MVAWFVTYFILYYTNFVKKKTNLQAIIFYAMTKLLQNKL